MNSAHPIIVSFFSENSGGAFIMKRIISKLKSKLKNYKNAITFYEFDIENDKILAQEFNVGIAPTIIIYKGAEIRAFFNGIVSFDYIESKIKAVSEN